MSLDINNIEKLEDFLAGRLNTEEASQVQSLIDKDPLLQSEASLQKDVINGLQEKRKLELKSRLNNITVKSTSYTKYYVAAASLATLLLGWVFVDNYNKEPKLDVAKLDTTEISKTQDEVKNLTSTESIHPSTENTIVENEENISIIEEQNTTNNVVRVETIAPLARPSVDLGPNADELEDAANAGEYPTDAPKVEKGILGYNKVNDRIKVNPVPSSAKHMRYTYLENQLQLVGPFNYKYPYVLTEMESDEELTLVFKGKTYKILKGKTDEPLKPIED